MRLTILIAVTVVFATLRGAQGQTPEDIPNGFRGLRWGQGVTKDLVLIRTQDDFKIYRRPTDDLKVETLTAKSIEYVFRNGRLTSVNLAFEGENAKKLQWLLKLRWGDPGCVMGEPTICAWKNRHTVATMLSNRDKGLGLLSLADITADVPRGR